MQCPQCRSQLQTNSSDVLICDNCGYVDQAIATIDTIVSLIPPTEPVAFEHYSFFKNYKRRILFTIGFILLIIGIFLTLQQIRAGQLLNDAVALNQKQQFNQAYDVLRQASGVISLPQTKQSIEDTLGKTKKWVTYQQNISRAKQLMEMGNYGEAATLLAQVTPDYPDYTAAKNALASATSSHDNTIAVGGLVLPQAGNTDTKSAVSAPVASSAPQKSTAPTTSSATTPQPSTAPSYIVTTALCRVDATAAPDLYQVAVNIVNTCQTMFPQIEQRLSASIYAAPHLITIANVDGVASTSGANVTFSASYLRGQPTDMGAVVHELTHVIQGYPSGSSFWITEGMADYIRFATGYSTSWSYSHCDSNSRYTSGYNCSAAFLKYVERVYMPTLIKSLHTKLRAGQYTDSFFTTTTGKTLEQLYSGCRTAECSGGKA